MKNTGRLRRDLPLLLLLGLLFGDFSSSKGEFWRFSILSVCLHAWPRACMRAIRVCERACWRGPEQSQVAVFACERARESERKRKVVIRAVPLLRTALVCDSVRVRGSARERELRVCARACRSEWRACVLMCVRVLG